MVWLDRAAMAGSAACMAHCLTLQMRDRGCLPHGLLEGIMRKWGGVSGRSQVCGKRLAADSVKLAPSMSTGTVIVTRL